tara:strand:+ start:266 stop:469 length:204 start_codon:yes stop_codon:yes gene_type:complete
VKKKKEIIIQGSFHTIEVRVGAYSFSKVAVCQLGSREIHILQVNPYSQMKSENDIRERIENCESWKG